MRARHVVAVLAVTGALPVALAACSGEDDTAGFGLPTLSSTEAIGLPAEPLEGTVVVEANGCFDLETPDGERHWIVWPEGTRLGDDGDQVVVRDATIGDGDQVRALGAMARAEALPGWENPDSYFVSFGTFCGADASGIVVLDQVSLD